MKPYTHMKKRLAKKRIGRGWSILCTAFKKGLEEGTVITTCHGYNEKIKEYDYCIFSYRKGYVVYDIDIETTDGNHCSLRHCCLFPPLSKDEVLFDWKHRFVSDEKSEWRFGKQHYKVLEAVKNGEDPFDENGCLLEKYKIKYPGTKDA